MLQRGQAGAVGAARRGDRLLRAASSATKPLAQDAAAATSAAAAAPPPTASSGAELASLHAPLAPRGAPGVRERVLADIRSEFPVRADLLAAASTHRAASAASAAASLRQDRLMAHMLLLCAEPSAGDLANPGRWAGVTYADLAASEAAGATGASQFGKTMSAQELADAAVARAAASAGRADDTDDAEADVLAALDGAEGKVPSSGVDTGSGSGGVSRKDLDAVFDVLMDELGQPMPKRGSGGASSSGASASSSAPTSAAAAEAEAAASGRPVFGVPADGGEPGFDAAVDASPSVLGGYVPSPSTEVSPLATAWLDVAVAHLDGVVARLRAHAAAAPAAVKAAGASGLLPLTGADATHAEAVLSALTAVPAVAVPEAAAAWLAGLPPAKLSTVMTHLLLRRRGLALPLGGGGSGAPDASLLTARLKAVEEAAGVLRSARDGKLGGGSSGGYPTLRQLHAALEAATGSASGGVPIFTPLRSAAAAQAARFRASLAAEQARLNAAVAHGRKTRESFLPADGGASPARPVPRFTVAVPDTASVLGAPGFAPETVTVAAAGCSDPSDDGAVTVRLAPAHAHARALTKGHLPSALAPLAAVLTPAEHATLTSLVVMATPALREALSHPLAVDAAGNLVPPPGADGGASSSSSGSDGEVTVVSPAPASASAATASSLADLADHLARTRNVRRALEAEAAGRAALSEALAGLDAASASGALPSGFDVAAWKDYVSFVLDMSGSGVPLAEGREAVVSQMLKAALAALPPGVRSRMAPSGDPILSELDKAGLTYEDAARGAGALAAARSGLTSDAEALAVAVGASFGDATGLGDLPVDSSAAVTAGAAAVPGGPSPLEAAGGAALPRPVVRQYYPLSKPVYGGPTGTTVVGYAPVATRHHDDLVAVGMGAM